MEKLLKAYLRKLTNLSSANRSLFLSRLTDGNHLDLHDLDFATNQTSFAIISALIAGKSDIKICPRVDAYRRHENQVSDKLRKISRQCRFIQEERGTRDLYVGWPMVRGRFQDGTIVQCPLMFFPVKLKEGDSYWYLSQVEAEEPQFNISFLLAYAYYNKLPLDEALAETDFSNFDKDSRVFRTELYQLFRDHSITLQFNQENFMDSLKPFSSNTKAEVENSEVAGVLRLNPQAVLGLFPQAGSYLVPDYLKMIEEKAFPDIEDFFLTKCYDEGGGVKFSRDYFLKKVREDQLITPFAMDASQENALKALKRGNSLVVQGPPGTGKSQLIANTVADYIAAGKRVLVVSQKNAALEVVHQRLDKAGLGNFAALVHDFKEDRKPLYTQIQLQVDNLSNYEQQNSGLDAIQLERKFLKTSRRIDQLEEELEEFKHALYDAVECGMSAKSLYLLAGQNLPVINLKQLYAYFPLGERDTFMPRYLRYAALRLQLDRPGYLWADRKSFANYGMQDRESILMSMYNIFEKEKGWTAKLGAYASAPVKMDTLLLFREKKAQIVELRSLLAQENVYDNFKHLIAYADKDTDMLWLNKMEKVVNGSFKGKGPELSVGFDELGRLQETIEHAIQARQHVRRYLSWKFFSRRRAWLNKVLKANDLPLNSKGVYSLSKKADARLNLEHNLDLLKQLPWIKGMPDNLIQVDIQSWFYYQKKALLAKLFFNDVRQLKDYFFTCIHESNTMLKALDILIDVLNEVEESIAAWKEWLPANQILNIAAKPELMPEYQRVLEQDFEAIRSYDELQDNLQVQERDLLDKLFDELRPGSAKQFEALLTNSLCFAWIDHIETKYPMLRQVSDGGLQAKEKELQTLIKDKTKVSKHIALMKVREKTYKNASFNRLHNMITYRDVYHQVTKKRQVWPVRKVLNQFSDEIFDLLPCWLASPESVAALFPMEVIFDLVIFDEASQCYAEKGIPAMYRGRQIMIAGDEQQLRPEDIYSTRFTEEHDDEGDLSAESLLELAARYLPNLVLQGHYRSKHTSLIAFSNLHYYHNKLQLLPHFEDSNTTAPPIVYQKVEGVWENNANAVEAKAVALQVKELLDHQKDDIGIITFNYAQQQCIWDELEKTLKEIPERIFVKNIENVQGDEREIIIFSTGYGRDIKGKLRMNFGSLNREHGENRLNVAVTRAKEKIYIISSLWPEDLEVKKAKHAGPLHFKAYLQYAKNVNDGKVALPIDDRRLKAAEWYVKDRWQELLEAQSISSSRNLPFADITLEKEKLCRGIMLTDDDLYHDAISVKAAHGYRPIQLKTKQWPFVMGYSRDYWLNKEAVLMSVEKMLYNEQTIEEELSEDVQG